MSMQDDLTHHSLVAAIRTARLGKGWTQAQLHLKSGVNLSDISRIETGRLVPSPAQVKKLERALGLARG